MKPVSLLLAACLALLPALAVGAKKGPMYAVPEADKSRQDLATLVLPEAIDIQMVDGFEYPGFKNLFRRGDILVRILPGERQVALKYNQLFEWGNGEHEMVRSKVIVLGFTAEPGKTYRVGHDQYKTVQEARKGVENFVLRLTDADGRNVVFGASQVSSNWKGEETVMKRTDLASPDAAAAALAARPAVVVAPVAASVVDGAAAPASTAAGGAFESLKFIWQNAGEADRAAFRAWIASPPPAVP